MSTTIIRSVLFFCYASAVIGTTIEGTHFKSCPREFGDEVAHITIDMRALTYEQWFQACGDALRSWERGTIAQGETLQKIKTASASSYTYPSNWNSLAPTLSGSFLIHEDYIIEKFANGEEWLRYRIDAF